MKTYQLATPWSIYRIIAINQTYSYSQWSLPDESCTRADLKRCCILLIIYYVYSKRQSIQASFFCDHAS